MSKSTLRNLAIVLFALVAIMIAVEFGARGDNASGGDLLFPDLRAELNDISTITIVRNDRQATVIERDADASWRVSSRDNYSADVGKVRELLLAVADARVLEEKTANPERYEALGVRDPEEVGSVGVQLSIGGTIGGNGTAADLIVGNLNQGAYRYVRRAGDARSLLIDANPEVPDDDSDWLATELVDLAAAEIESVTVRHADGEEIRAIKNSPEDTNFEVQDLPVGRELSYGTVANGMGSVLQDLRLEDVRLSDAENADAVTSTAFETISGMRLVVEVYPGEEETRWVTFRAASLGGEDANGDATAAEESVAPATLAAEINARLEGWQFRLPTYKANQLTRRWDDILKPADDGE